VEEFISRGRLSKHFTWKSEMKPANLLFIMSDEHRRDASGCYGNSVIHTPNLDSLAARGTRFTNAYTNSPICVPARASFASGHYVHQTGHWDNAFPYFGQPTGWAHELKTAGRRADSIGKLHYRSAGDDNGFTNEIDAMYVVEGVGEIISCLRERTPNREGRGGIVKAGPGYSPYLRYDATSTAEATRWLAEHANDDRPWVLFLSLVCPHPPFTAPQNCYDLYDHADMPLPLHWQQEDWPSHPALTYFREHFGWTEPIDEEAIRRMTATYYALTTYVDQNVGKVLGALDNSKLTESTRVIYTSDHGAMIGSRGLFGKFQMYDDAAAIPIIMAGPDVPRAKVAETPVSLVDCYPTILESAGLEPDTSDRPGESLWQIAQEPDRTRTILSEYHAAGTKHAIFMICDGRWKYIHYCHEDPQLFDLTADPQEQNDLAASPDHQDILKTYEHQLRSILDPEAVDAETKADQLAKVEAFGGEQAVIDRGLSNSPVPGLEPVFHYFN
jgi:choline-sulfatase